MYLIKFQSDYADEFDVYGFVALSSLKDFNKQLSFAQTFWEEYPGREVEVGFGTNESFRYDNYDSFYESFEVVEITPEEFKMLQRLFPGYDDTQVGWGFTGTIQLDAWVWESFEFDNNERLSALYAELWPEFP